MSRNNKLSKKEWTAVIIGILGLVLTGGSILAGVIQDSYSAQRIRRQRAIDFGQEWNSTVYDGIVDDDVNIVASHQKNASPDKYRIWLVEVATSNRNSFNAPADETFAASEASKRNDLGAETETMELGTSVTDSTLRERLRIRSSLNEFLNFLETVCLAYQYETADREIMERSSIPAVKHFAEMLKPYMDKLREGNPSLWQAIYDVAKLDNLSPASEKPNFRSNDTSPGPD